MRQAGRLLADPYFLRSGGAAAFRAPPLGNRSLTGKMPSRRLGARASSDSLDPMLVRPVRREICRPSPKPRDARKLAESSLQGDLEAICCRNVHDMPGCRSGSFRNPRSALMRWISIRKHGNSQYRRRKPGLTPSNSRGERISETACEDGSGEADSSRERFPRGASSVVIRPNPHGGACRWKFVPNVAREGLYLRRFRRYGAAHSHQPPASERGHDDTWENQT